MTLDPTIIKTAVIDAHSAASRITGGENASYIPYLAAVPPELFGLAAVTTDGQIFEAGDTRIEFPIESLSKIVTMALVIETLGAETLRAKVGTDSTGMSFNSVIAMELNGGHPQSPLVNAGAMTTVSLVPAESSEARWQTILAFTSRMAGRPLTMSEEINQSEQASNFRNRAIAWLLCGGGSLYADPMEVCDVYTRQCSVLVNTVDLAIIGATLAGGGVNPLTHERILTASNVKFILAEMTMEGLYERSGDWAFEVGLPAKTGVGGGILAVAPGQLAIAGFAPPLDAMGNTVRGQAGVAAVARTLGLNIFAT